MEANNIRPFLIGICGGSSAGKTLLLQEIAASINSDYKVCKISLVNYYKNLSEEDYKKKEIYNFDKPEAVDFDLLYSNLESLLNKKTTELPKYDINSCLRKEEKESEDKSSSGYGMEFTLKLKKDNYENEEEEIKCICGILQSIARITFTSKELFNPYEYLYTGQTEGIDTKMKSNITGFITIPDKEIEPIMTPNGKVNFVEFIGVTNDELLALKNKELDVKTLYNKIGSDITNYNRKSVI